MAYICHSSTYLACVAFLPPVKKGTIAATGGSLCGGVAIMHDTERDPLFARLDDAIETAHRMLDEAELLLARSIVLCRNAVQSRILQAGLSPTASIALLVMR